MKLALVDIQSMFCTGSSVTKVTLGRDFKNSFIFMSCFFGTFLRGTRLPSQEFFFPPKAPLQLKWAKLFLLGRPFGGALRGVQGEEEGSQLDKELGGAALAFQCLAELQALVHQVHITVSHPHRRG